MKNQVNATLRPSECRGALLAGGQLKPETVPPYTLKYIIDKPF